ncbi:MAG: hypothetical protein DRI44_05835 [Chlamydiae bacterium]|nr:MAG: hypothetical protein DRI44_05835 [Chlamydiota bacterium]
MKITGIPHRQQCEETSRKKQTQVRQNHECVNKYLPVYHNQSMRTHSIAEIIAYFFHSVKVDIEEEK